jgi:GrpB-like predicted nucleotidyltransferase (UPF0157 family)
MKDAPVEVLPYSNEWPQAFAAEACALRIFLSPWLAGPIEHIGSTAVPGLAAKPIIDIMAPVVSLEHASPAINALPNLGYCYFPYRPEEMHWFCKPSPALRTHHLHLVPVESTLWAQRLAFRDALRSDPAVVREYEQLKLQLAAEFKHDREAYTEGKSHFVQAVLARAAAGASWPRAQ